MRRCFERPRAPPMARIRQFTTPSQRAVLPLLIPLDYTVLPEPVPRTPVRI